MEGGGAVTYSQITNHKIKYFLLKCFCQANGTTTILRKYFTVFDLLGFCWSVGISVFYCEGLAILARILSQNRIHFEGQLLCVCLLMKTAQRILSYYYLTCHLLSNIKYCPQFCLFQGRQLAIFSLSSCYVVFRVELGPMTVPPFLTPAFSFL